MNSSTSDVEGAAEKIENYNTLFIVCSTQFNIAASVFRLSYVHHKPAHVQRKQSTTNIERRTEKALFVISFFLSAVVGAAGMKKSY